MLPLSCDNETMLANEAQFRALVDFFHTGTKQSYEKGEFIVRPGAEPPGIFYIEEGLVKTYDITKYGEENLLIIRKAGEIIGLTWAITDTERHVINTAMSSTVVWLVPRDTFLAFIREHPEACLPVADTITEMYRLHSERIMTLEYRTVRERLASFLLTMGERFGHETKDGILIDVPLRHQDIASSISATRETTSRVLSDLERKGIIHGEQSRITVCDVQALNSFIE